MLEGQQHYEGREQTWVKHNILGRYLEVFALIIGSKWPSITYIDGFSGPWKAQSEDLSDSSFSVALTALRKARQAHARKGRSLDIRCAFVEKSRPRFRELEAFAQSVTDATTCTINSEFESAVPQMVQFVQEDPNTFAFTFIDNTGWTGFSLPRIAPLLRLRNSEVLINIMSSFIGRFITAEETRTSLAQLFGTTDYDERLSHLSGISRDDGIAELYCDRLGQDCDFQHVHRAIILYPNRDQTHFQLIYGTRHPKGVQKFKEVEKSAMKSQEKLRAKVEQQRSQSTGQMSFLDPAEMPESAYYRQLRHRYTSQAKRTIASTLNAEYRASYDSLWFRALTFPMVWESDLHDWLNRWLSDGAVEWEGKRSREKTFKKSVGHVVVRKAERIQTD